MSEEASKCRAIHEETSHQIVPRRRCGNTPRATPEALEAGAPMAVLAGDPLRRCVAHRGLLGLERALGGAPPSGGQAREAPRAATGLQREHTGLFAPPTDRRAPLSARRIQRLPSPPRLRVLPPIPPPRLPCGGQPAT